MNLKMFRWKLDAYGGNMARWPAAEAMAAVQLLESSPEARNLYQQAQAVEQAMDEFAVPAAPHLAVTAANGALAKARATPIARPRRGRWMKAPRPRWQLLANGAGGVLVALALIFLAGGNPFVHHHDPSAAKEVTAFITDMDRMHNAEQAQLQEADEMVSMLSPDQEQDSGQ